MVEVIGLELETHHPVIEPVSAAEPGTEVCDAERGPPKITTEMNGHLGVGGCLGWLLLAYRSVPFRLTAAGPARNRLEHFGVMLERFRGRQIGFACAWRCRAQRNPAEHAPVPSEVLISGLSAPRAGAVSLDSKAGSHRQLTWSYSSWPHEPTGIHCI
jgi:hypothetical protein